MNGKDVAHLPGDAGFPLAGNTIAWLKDPHQFSIDMVNAHGPVFRSRLGVDWNVTLMGASANEFVLRDRDNVFSNRHGWGSFLDQLFPNGLMLQDFDEHRIDRRALAGAFTPAAIGRYVSSIHTLMKDEVPRWAGAQTFLPVIKEFALQTAADSFIGISWGGRAARLNEQFVAMVQASTAINRLPLPGTAIKAGVDARAELVNYFREECLRRRNDDAIGDDLFSQFCHATHDDGSLLAVDKVVDHIIFLMMAAHDTFTSSSLSVVHLLAAHPEWQERLRSEMADAVGVAPFGGDHEVTYDDLAQLVETELVFMEALRTRSPLPAMPRRALKDFSFGGYDIPAGVRVGIDVHYTHHDPTYWDSPDRFDPLRFSTDRRSERPEFAYIPFGGGVHKCLGARFATMQMRLLLIHLLSNFEISLEPGYSPKWLAYPIQKPKDGLQVTLTPLSVSSATVSRPSSWASDLGTGL